MFAFSFLNYHSPITMAALPGIHGLSRPPALDETFSAGNSASVAWTGRYRGAGYAPALVFDRPAQVEPGSAAPTVSGTSTIASYSTPGAGVKDYFSPDESFLSS